MPKREVHVLPSDEGWRIEVDDEERARSIHPTQADAIAKAREHAQASVSYAFTDEMGKFATVSIERIERALEILPFDF